MKKRGLAGLLALALILALAACGGTEAQEDAAQDQKMEEAAPVSYTHLTLPTILLV